MKRYLGHVLAMASIMSALDENMYEGDKPDNDLRPENINVQPKILPVPKGCKRYYFCKQGECYEGQHEIYFDALTKKNAYKKFERWKAAINPPAHLQ